MAYANDDKTLSKVFQLNKTLDDYRSSFLNNTMDFINRNKTFKYDSNNRIKIDMNTKNQLQKKQSKIIQESREKFEGKLHYLDVKCGTNKSLEILEKIQKIKHQDSSFKEDFVFFENLRDKKKNSQKTKSSHLPFDKSLSDRKKISLKIQCLYNYRKKEDIKIEKSGLSIINLSGIGSDSVETHRSMIIFQQKKKKKKNNQISEAKIKENETANEAYFPKIEANKSFMNKKPSSNLLIFSDQALKNENLYYNQSYLKII